MVFVMKESQRNKTFDEDKTETNGNERKKEERIHFANHYVDNAGASQWCPPTRATSQIGKGEIRKAGTRIQSISFPPSIEMPGCLYLYFQRVIS